MPRNPAIDNLLRPICTFYTNAANGILSTLQPQPILVTYAPASTILHSIYLPHTHFLFPIHHSKSRENSISNTQFPAHPLTVKLWIWFYLIHFLQNNSKYLLELKSSLVINRSYKRIVENGWEFSKWAMRGKSRLSTNMFFFLSLCHKLRPL